MQQMLDYLNTTFDDNKESRYVGAFAESLNMDAARNGTPVDGKGPIRYHVLWNYTGYHSVPIMMNVLNSGVARALYGVDIVTKNAPFNYTSSQKDIIDNAQGLVFGYGKGREERREKRREEQRREGRDGKDTKQEIMGMGTMIWVVVLDYIASLRL